MKFSLKWQVVGFSTDSSFVAHFWSLIEIIVCSYYIHLISKVVLLEIVQYFLSTSFKILQGSSGPPYGQLFWISLVAYASKKNLFHVITDTLEAQQLEFIICTHSVCVYSHLEIKGVTAEILILLKLIYF